LWRTFTTASKTTPEATPSCPRPPGPNRERGAFGPEGGREVSMARKALAPLGLMVAGVALMGIEVLTPPARQAPAGLLFFGGFLLESPRPR
jgi:hypothetical protein